MHSPPCLPKSWFLHSRTFWLGLLVTAFVVWLTIDSHLHTSVLRTIHRGSLRDWSGESTIPSGTPGESGSLVLGLMGGAVAVTWIDQLAPEADYSGRDERERAEPRLRKIWLPKLFTERDSLMRRRGAYLPTWVLLACWLAIWARQLAKSKQRHLTHLTPGGLTAP